MTVVRIDEDDLDDEDRAILAEVSKKGYYHGRPKSVACTPPQKLQQPVILAAGETKDAEKTSRTEFDTFQQKWDRFDDDAFLADMEEIMETAPCLKTASIPARSLRIAAAAEFKLVLLGDGGVGKTAFLKRHLTGELQRMYVPTVGEEVTTLGFNTNCGFLIFNVWEVAGQVVAGSSPSNCVPERCLSGSHGAIIMFDVSSRTTYKNVPNWHQNLQRMDKVVPTILAANKVDTMCRQVPPKLVTFHKKWHIQNYELSVRSGRATEMPFLWLARRLTNQPSLQFTGERAMAPGPPVFDANRAAEDAEQRDRAHSVALVHSDDSDHL